VWCASATGIAISRSGVKGMSRLGSKVDMAAL